MLTPTEITNGNLRLTLGKLKSEDVSGLVSLFRLILAGLEERYNYQYKQKLELLDDNADAGKNAAQVAAILIKLETFGFGVAELTGQRGSGVKFKQLDRYIQHVLFAFSKIYPVPAEFSIFEIKRAILLGSFSSDSYYRTGSGGSGSSGSIPSTRG